MLLPIGCLVQHASQWETSSVNDPFWRHEDDVPGSRTVPLP
ncbi:hypothetical protein CABS03_09281 [Colletotrichum abscissum]|uniref:Uncharacterized protein n=1 Tax=Colletotrichum abscissum TaxID=1671311 RepID=A0A9Q0B1L6_9PEZI|nr:hypothetical protein CABS02_10991 [Colletotrichum abscissum]